MPTETLATWSLQKAIYGRLAGAISWGTPPVVVPVYDEVPDNPAFPYIVIGDDSASDFFDKDVGGNEVVETIHVWSRYRGHRQVKELMNSVLAKLFEGSLSYEGFCGVSKRLETSEVMRDIDGFTRHGILRLRFKLQAKEA